MASIGRQFVKSPVSNSGIYEILSDFQQNAGYIGSRFYFDRICLFGARSFAPYIGLKAGLAVQDRVPFDSYAAGVNVNAGAPIYRRQVAVSGGAQLGVEWLFYRCLTLLLQGEIVATQGPRGNTIIVGGNAVGIVNSIIGPTGLLIHYPITLGLRRAF